MLGNKFRHMSAILAATMMSIGSNVGRVSESMRANIESKSIPTNNGKVLHSANKISQKKRRIRARQSGSFSK